MAFVIADPQTKVDDGDNNNNSNNDTHDNDSVHDRDDAVRCICMVFPEEIAAMAAAVAAAHRHSQLES